MPGRRPRTASRQACSASAAAASGAPRKRARCAAPSRAAATSASGPGHPQGQVSGTLVRIRDDVGEHSVELTTAGRPRLAVHGEPASAGVQSEPARPRGRACGRRTRVEARLVLGARRLSRGCRVSRSRATPRPAAPPSNRPVASRDALRAPRPHLPAGGPCSRVERTTPLDRLRKLQREQRVSARYLVNARE